MGLGNSTFIGHIMETEVFKWTVETDILFSKLYEKITHCSFAYENIVDIFLI